MGERVFGVAGNSVVGNSVVGNSVVGSELGEMAPQRVPQ